MTKAELIAALSGLPNDSVIFIEPIPSGETRVPNDGDVFDVANVIILDALGDHPASAVLSIDVNYDGDDANVIFLDALGDHQAS